MSTITEENTERRIRVPDLRSRTKEVIGIIWFLLRALEAKGLLLPKQSRCVMAMYGLGRKPTGKAPNSEELNQQITRWFEKDTVDQLATRLVRELREQASAKAKAASRKRKNEQRKQREAEKKLAGGPQEPEHRDDFSVSDDDEEESTEERDD